MENQDSKQSVVGLSVNNKQNVAFIIGNGFNYLIRDIVDAYPIYPLPSAIRSTKKSIVEEIGKITSLWKKFDELFKDLQEKNPQYRDEELIRMIYSVIDFLSNIETFKKILKPALIEELKKAFEFLLIERIREIAKEFSDHEASQGYKDLKKLFPDFGKDFKAMIESNRINQFDYFTTNYDGILDTLLTLPDHKFVAADGFGQTNTPGYYGLKDASLRMGKIRGLHIHGSYKFTKSQGDTYKIKAEIKNSEPVMIFNNPQFKGDLIRRDPVLNQYFYTLANSLMWADKLVIFGNSMKNEPHIKQLIGSLFIGTEQRLYICSNNPKEVTQQIKAYFKGEIIEYDTNHIKSIDALLSLFNEIFSEQIN